MVIAAIYFRAKPQKFSKNEILGAMPAKIVARSKKEPIDIFFKIR
jgi:hypothetical protein